MPGDTTLCFLARDFTHIPQIYPAHTGILVCQHEQLLLLTLAIIEAQNHVNYKIATPGIVPLQIWPLQLFRTNTFVFVSKFKQSILFY